MIELSEGSKRFKI